MREILFRGRRIDNGEWVYGFYFCMHHDDDREHIHHFIIPLNVPLPKDKPIGEIQVEVDPDTVGQCVSDLPDKNGKKIFEGDIAKIKVDFCTPPTVNAKRFKKDIGVVCFQESSFVVRNGDSIYGMIWITEIIGNIHDNPELLEDKP